VIALAYECVLMFLIDSLHQHFHGFSGNFFKYCCYCCHLWTQIIHQGVDMFEGVCLNSMLYVDTLGWCWVLWLVLAGWVGVDCLGGCWQFSLVLTGWIGVECLDWCLQMELVLMIWANIENLDCCLQVELVLAVWADVDSLG